MILIADGEDEDEGEYDDEEDEEESENGEPGLAEIYNDGKQIIPFQRNNWNFEENKKKLIRNDL